MPTTREVLIPDGGFLGRHVRLYESHGEAAPELHLGVALAVLGAALGPNARVRWGGDGGEPCAVWPLMVARSGAQKSTAMGAGRRLVSAATEHHNGSGMLHAGSLDWTSAPGLLKLVGPKDDDQAEEWKRAGAPGWLLDCDEAASLFGPRRGERHSFRDDLQRILLTAYGGILPGQELRNVHTKGVPCALSLLGVTTFTDLAERLTLDTVRTGWWGRWLPIPVPPGDNLVPMPPPWRGVHAAELHEIGRVLDAIAHDAGRIGDVWEAWTEGALDARRTWYVDRMTELGAAAATGDELAGARFDLFRRYQAHAVKLAVLRAVSDEFTVGDRLPVMAAERFVDANHAAWGMQVVEGALVDAIELVEAAGIHEDARIEGAIVEVLVELGPVTLGKLSSGHLVRGEPQRLHAALDRMARTDRIVVEARGPRQYVTLPGQDEDRDEPHGLV